MYLQYALLEHELHKMRLIANMLLLHRDLMSAQIKVACSIGTGETQIMAGGDKVSAGTLIASPYQTCIIDV